eukprot:CAMPEP_0113935998 /NCGR_PEP_ID=MMETSP1339-20121228/3003_1 /TAXON_ID=94617 /ORGANISM="Fibrocapsa japonica" /LENGTH=194 /DNA_ID=CAMNT_0000938313 /DNA_START=372 /DNA_END=959 /DNA_ORIENTATION=+ /assembly_acc=CAM_ASM_000762
MTLSVACSDSTVSDTVNDSGGIPVESFNPSTALNPSDDCLYVGSNPETISAQEAENPESKQCEKKASSDECFPSSQSGSQTPIEYETHSQFMSRRPERPRVMAMYDEACLAEREGEADANNTENVQSIQSYNRQEMTREVLGSQLGQHICSGLRMSTSEMRMLIDEAIVSMRLRILELESIESIDNSCTDSKLS